MVNPNATISLTSAAVTTSQTPCINIAIANITYITGGGATGASFSGLPAGVNGSFSAGTVTITGAPTVPGTFNYVITTTGTCLQASVLGSIIVSPATIGGTVGSNAIACSGVNSGTLNLTGNVGSVIRWEFSINGGTVWSAIVNTSASLTYTNLTQTTQYRAVIQSGVCTAANSSAANITVNPPFTPVITSTPLSPICLGQPVTLTATGFSALGDISGGDFASSNPAGWLVDGASNTLSGSANNGQPNTWSLTNSNTFYGPTYNSQFGGKFVIANGARSAILETPVFSTVGRLSAALDLYQAFILTAGTTAKIEISINGGASYNTILAQYNPPATFGTPNLGFANVNIPLTNYQGMPNLRIRFTYSSAGNSAWAMDNINISGTYQPVTYAWTAAPGLTASGATATVTPPVGINTYTVTTTTGGCTSTTSNITINVNPLPTITTSATAARVCFGTTTTSLAYSAVSNSPTFYSIIWSATPANTFAPVTDATLNPSSISISIPANTVAGTFTGTITVKNANGCISSTGRNFSVIINPLPVISGNLSVCAGATSQLAGNGAPLTPIAWVSSSTGVATVSNSGLVSAIAPGISIITYTNSNTCKITATVTVNPLPITTGVAICQGGTGSLTSSLGSTLTGPRNAGRGTDSIAVGTGIWTGTSNFIAPGTPHTLQTLTSGATTTHYLKGANYGFLIPAGAIINGITVVINRQSSTGTFDNGVFLLKAGSVAGNDMSNLTVWPVSFGTATYGGTTNLWGTTWTPADINSLNFGVVLSAKNNTAGSRVLEVDYMQINVTYTIPGTLNWYTVSSGGAAIGSGSPFNPVGVANSGLTNTNTAGTTIFYAESSATPGCRTAANFIINSLPVITGVLSTCAGFQTQLTGSGTPAAWASASPGVATVSNTGLVTGVTGGTSLITYTNSNGCSITTTVTISSGYVWTGNGINNLWSNAANWNACGVPPNNSNVTIPDVSPKFLPKLDVDFISNNFDLQGNATIEISAQKLTLGNALSSLISANGFIIGSSASNLVINGTINPSLKFNQAVPGTSNALKDLTFNCTGQTIILANPLNIIGNLIPTAGTLNSSGFLTMVSTAATTSNIGSLVAGVSDVSEIVNVESWLTGGPATNSISTNANRGTRTMSSPVNDASTVPNIFKQLQAVMFITGAGTGGFDVFSTDPFPETLFTYKEPARYDQAALAQYNVISDISTTRMPKGIGFFLYYRGDRSDNNTATGSKVVAPFDTPESFAITYKGQINKGDIPINLSYTSNSGLRDNEYNGFNFVGNPYPSTIDWTKVERSDNSVVENMISTSKPGGGMITYSGGIVTNGGQAALPASINVASPNYTPASPFYIQPGLGFYVRTRAAGSSITFKESSKTITVAGNPVAPLRLLSTGPMNQNAVNPKVLRIKLQDAFNTDETAIVFKQGFDALFGPLDATYLTGSSVSLSSQTSDGKNVAINFMPDIKDVSSVKLTVNASKSGVFKLIFSGVADLKNCRVVLKDNFLNTESDLRANPVYDFQVDRTNASTFGPERLIIIFSPVKESRIRVESFIATKVKATAELNWTSNNNKDIRAIEIQHSANNLSFSKIGVIKSLFGDASQSFTFSHNKPADGLNHYRLVYLSIGGDSLISEIRDLTYSDNQSKRNLVQIYPNPVGSEFDIRVDQEISTTILVGIYDLLGTKISSTNFLHQNVAALAPGIYIVKLVDLSTGKTIGQTRFVKY